MGYAVNTWGNEIVNHGDVAVTYSNNEAFIAAGAVGQQILNASQVQDLKFINSSRGWTTFWDYLLKI